MKKFKVVPKLLKIYTKPVSIMVALFGTVGLFLPHHENNAGVITFQPKNFRKTMLGSN